MQKFAFYTVNSVKIGKFLAKWSLGRARHNFFLILFFKFLFQSFVGKGLGGILGCERFPKRSPGGSCGAKSKKWAWGRARDDDKKGPGEFLGAKPPETISRGGWADVPRQSPQKQLQEAAGPQTKPPKTSTKGRLVDIPRQNHQKRLQKDAWWTSPDKTAKNDYKRTPGELAFRAHVTGKVLRFFSFSHSVFQIPV